MPPDFIQDSVSNMTSILSSIRNDRHVYRWFLMAISLKDVRQKLCQQSQTNQAYESLKKTQITEIITYAVLALIITIPCLIKQPLILLGGSIPLVILMKLFQKNRKCVVTISERFLQENTQPEELNQQTLYQTCEMLSKKLNTPSLVDIITYQDIIGRKVLLGAIFFIPFIYPLHTGQIIIVTLTVFWASLAIVNTSIVLQKLK